MPKEDPVPHDSPHNVARREHSCLPLRAAHSTELRPKSVKDIFNKRHVLQSNIQLNTFQTACRHQRHHDA